MDYSDTPINIYDEWIVALYQDINASITEPVPTQPFSYINKPISRNLGMCATAYFLMPNTNIKNTLLKEIPKRHLEFQNLTGNVLKFYQSSSSGKILKNYSQEKLATDFAKQGEDITGIPAFTGFDKYDSPQSSPTFLMKVLLDFEYELMPERPNKIYSYLNVCIPHSWWKENQEQFNQWWLKTLEILKPEQAYFGINYSYPSHIQEYAFAEYAEKKLAQKFYGYDIDKPFFMRSSESDAMHLEEGIRTPTYGILLQGKWLEMVGGRSTITRALGRDTDFKLVDINNGIWIEAVKAPALYPVGEGVPPHLQRLYKVVKPAVLNKLWMIGFLPAVPDSDTFTPEESSRWLKRFEDDSDWPSAEIRAETRKVATTDEKPKEKVPAIWGGEPATHTGRWMCSMMLEDSPNRIQHFNKGDILPAGDSPKGKYIWHYLDDRDS